MLQVLKSPSPKRENKSFKQSEAAEVHQNWSTDQTDGHLTMTLSIIPFHNHEFCRQTKVYFQARVSTGQTDKKLSKNQFCTASIDSILHIFPC